jgi:hypothetical protein
LVCRTAIEAEFGSTPERRLAGRTNPAIRLLAQRNLGLAFASLAANPTCCGLLKQPYKQKLASREENVLLRDSCERGCSITVSHVTHLATHGSNTLRIRVANSDANCYLASIRNRDTRAEYAQAVTRFFAWCEERGGSGASPARRRGGVYFFFYFLYNLRVPSSSALGCLGFRSLHGQP